MISGGQQKNLEIIKDCQDKSKYHRQQASYANNWFQLISLTSVVITALQALVMTLETVYNTDNVSVTVTGAVFAFVLAIFNRINTSFQFNVVSVQNHYIADSFVELQKLFEMLDEEDQALYRQYMQRYVSIIEMSHLLPVCKSRLLFCCCK